MLPIMFLLWAAGSVGEPISTRVASIDQKARMYPPKRSPWYGTSDAAMKVTLWNGGGSLPQKMRVDANLGGGRARDYYWFDAGKPTYGTQSRWSNGEAVERRLTFAAGKLTAAQERRGAGSFQTVSGEELAKLNASISSLLKECFGAPGLKDRKAMVKAVEQDRVILETAPGVQAWISRRSGDNVAPSLVGRQVTYDFTAVDQDGEERDFLNALQPAGAAKAMPAKAMAASDPAEPVAAEAAPAKTAIKKKSTARKTTRKKGRARKAAVKR
jgi:hypothetical protein